MARYLFFIFILFFYLSCKTKPYLNKTITLEKVGATCVNGDETIKMNSNINGERYEIYKCLDEDFKKNAITISRSGDTVNIIFDNQAKNKAFFKATIDIDTYPRYNFININGAVTPIVPASN